MPTGVAHGVLAELHCPFEMVSAYPVGPDGWDMCNGSEGEVKVKAIRHVPWSRYMEMIVQQSGAGEEGGQEFCWQVFNLMECNGGRLLKFTWS